MQSEQNNACCNPRQKISRLSLQTHRKAAMVYIPAFSFLEFLVQINKESHSYGKLIIMAISAVHVSYNLDFRAFVRSSREGNKKISDSFWRRHN